MMRHKWWLWALAGLALGNVIFFAADSLRPVPVVHPATAVYYSASTEAHWTPVPDFDTSIANRLSPKTINSVQVLSEGGTAVVHRLGSKYYRIYSQQGNVYYMVWRP